MTTPLPFCFHYPFNTVEKQLLALPDLSRRSQKPTKYSSDVYIYIYIYDRFHKYSSTYFEPVPSSSPYLVRART